MGWKREKDSKSRKFLSDLKKASIEYNNFPLKYITERIDYFYNCWDFDSKEFLFIHIREPEEIDKVKDYCKEHVPKAKIKTLLIKRPGIGDYGNNSDDNTENYNYDFTFINDCAREELEEKFMSFFSTEVLKSC